MPYKILIWNTQHFHNQSKKESEAYQAKAAYLSKVLLLKRPDILALFETGTTGVPNVSAEKLLESRGYRLVHALDNEGGARIDTTLGSMVFVRNELAGAFEMLSDYILGASERRAPIVIRHKYNGDALAFYHA
ncbi:endonuclease/exonuclease/phosphatase family protein, partial [Pseudomonas sp. HMWF005]